MNIWIGGWQDTKGVRASRRMVRDRATQLWWVWAGQEEEGAQRSREKVEATARAVVESR